MDYSGYCNAALRKVAPPGRSFDGVGSEGTLQAGHVRSLFSANQIRGLKSGRQIIEVRSASSVKPENSSVTNLSSPMEKVCSGCAQRPAVSPWKTCNEYRAKISK